MYSFRSVRFITIPETGSICRGSTRDIGGLAAQTRQEFLCSGHLSHKENILPLSEAPSSTPVMFPRAWYSLETIPEVPLSPGRDNSLAESSSTMIKA